MKDQHKPIIRRRDESPSPEPESLRKKITKAVTSIRSNIRTSLPRPQFGQMQTEIPKISLRRSNQKTSSPRAGGSLSHLLAGISAPSPPNFLWLQIAPKEGGTYTNQKLLRMISHLPASKFIWRILNGHDNQIRFYFGIASNDGSPAKNALLTALGDIEIAETESFDLDVPMISSAIQRVGQPGQSLLSKTEKLVEDLLTNLDGCPCSVDIQFSKATPTPHSAGLRTPDLPTTSKKSPADNEESMWDTLNFLTKGDRKPKKELKKETGKPDPIAPTTAQSYFGLFFDVEIHVRAFGPSAQTIISSIAAVLDTSLGHEHRLILSGGKQQAALPPGSTPTKTWKEAELLSLLNMPNMNSRVAKRVISVKAGQRLLRNNELNHGIAVGRANHPFQKNRQVYIDYKVILKHLVATGKNGSGKSSTVVMMLQSMVDIWLDNPDKNPGFTFVDPAQATLTIILNRLLHAEQQGFKVPWEKIHYFRLGPGSMFPIGLNLFYRLPHESIHDVQQTVRNLLAYAYGGQTARMDKFLRNSIYTLLSDKTQTHNLLGIIPSLRSEKFRKSVPIDDPVVRDFWKTAGALDEDDLGVLQTRLDPLIGNPDMRNLFGRSDWTPEIRKWMDEGHIVLFDLKGLSKNDVKLTAGHMTNRYYVEALQRPEDRSKFHVYLMDEAHHSQVPVLPEMQATIRKHGVATGLITQFPEQFNKDLLLSISENVGTYIACKQGKDSGPEMSKMMNGRFSPETLRDLPERNAAVYTEALDPDIGKTVTTTFIVEADPPVIYLPNGKPANYLVEEEQAEAQLWAQEKAMELMRRDCKSRSEVQAEIEEYLEGFKHFEEA